MGKSDTNLPYPSCVSMLHAPLRNSFASPRALVSASDLPSTSAWQGGETIWSPSRWYPLTHLACIRRGSSGHLWLNSMLLLQLTSYRGHWALVVFRNASSCRSHLFFWWNYRQRCENDPNVWRYPCCWVPSLGTLGSVPSQSRKVLFRAASEPTIDVNSKCKMKRIDHKHEKSCSYRQHVAL